MIIYNVTVNIDNTVREQWLNWMQQKHIPEILETGKFLSAKIVKVLVDEPMGGTTYSVQYHCKNKEILQEYYDHDAPLFRAEGIRLFGDKMIAFRTELELISEYFLDQSIKLKS